MDKKNNNVGTKMSDDYNNSGKIQTKFGNLLVDELSKTIKEININNPERLQNNNEPFIICDLGCSLGLSSIQFLQEIFTEIRKINKNLPIEVYLEDTPFNDFSLTLKTVNENLKEFSGVKYHTLPISFYEKLFPANSVDLFYSSFAMNWLPGCPFSQNQLIYACDNNKEFQPDYDKMESYINNCWGTQMELRNTELKPNGRILVNIPLIELDPTKSANVLLKYRLAKKVVNNVLSNYGCTELSDQMSIPLSFNSEKNLRETSKNKINITDIVKVESGQRNADREQYAAEYSVFFTSFTFGIYKDALSKKFKAIEVEEILANIKNQWKEALLKIDNFYYPSRCVVKGRKLRDMSKF